MPKTPYLLPSALFFAGVILFALFDGSPTSSWPNQIAKLLSAIGGLGVIWVWLGRRHK